MTREFLHDAPARQIKSPFNAPLADDPLEMPEFLLADTYEQLIVGDISAALAHGEFLEIIRPMAVMLPNTNGWLNADCRLIYGAALEALREGMDIADGASLARRCEKHGINAGHVYDILDKNMLPHSRNWRDHVRELIDTIARRNIFSAACKALDEVKNAALGTRQIAEGLSAVAAAAGPVEPADAEPFYIPMPVGCLPRAMRDYVGAVATALPCAEENVALPLLAALGSAIGNSRRIALKASWTEPAVIWAVTIMASGKLKSPAHDAAVKFLTDRQRRLISEHNCAMRRFEVDQLAWDDDRIRARRHKAASELSLPPQMPVCPRLTTSDCTVEALAELLAESPRGLLVQRDELAGWLGSFDRYASNSGGDLPAWLSMHRAGSLTVDRKTGKKLTFVPHAHVNICGTIQPATLRRCLTPDFFDSGLSARLLMAMPPAPLKRWSDAIIPPAAEAPLEALFDGLLALAPATETDSAGEDYAVPVVLDLSPEARRLWIAFYDRHAAEQEMMTDDRQSSAWSKLEAYAARFALIFTLCRDSAAAVIDGQSMADAITLTCWCGNETRRVYGMLAGQETDNPQAELIKLIQARFTGQVTARELAHASRRYRESGAAQAALQELVNSGLATWQSRTSKEGRPVNACILKQGGNAVTVTDVPPAVTGVTVTGATAATGAIGQAAGAEPVSPDSDRPPAWLEEENAAGQAAWRKAHEYAADDYEPGMD